ncbi:hypothetical protein [Amycolatopsis sp. cg9]|uniref:hypothetical protein n=1 Tax=Amycolatopsis sp. cg9 TaxID=3238801 RepID=UPI003525FDB0
MNGTASLVAVALLTLAGCATPPPAEDRFLPDKTTAQSAAEVEANTGVRLPAGSLLLSAARTSLSGGLESRTVAQVRMPAAVLDRFLADSGLGTPKPGERTVTDQDFPGSDTWHPDRATTVTGTGDARRRVMIATTSPDVTVYLVATQS